MKLYKLLLTCLLLFCCWSGAFAQCPFHYTSIHETTISGGTQLSFVPNGAPGPYTYHWSDGSTNALDTVHLSGVYFVTVTDTFGCTYHPGDTITTLPCYFIANMSYVNLGGNQYTATSHLTGATHPGYSWYYYDASGAGTWRSPTSQSGNTATFNLASGPSYWLVCYNYDSVLTGCSAVDSVLITPCNIHASFTYSHTASNVYTFVGTRTGGHAPFQYTWIVNGHGYPNSSTTFVDSLAAGFYQVCFEDSDINGCIATGCDTFTVPSLVNCGGLGVSIHDSISANTPIIVADVQGSHVLSAIFQWSDGSNQATILNPIPGAVYCVTVTDPVNHCTVSECDTICILNATVRDSIGGSTNNYTVTPQGTPPYYILWSSGSSYSTTNHFTVSSTSAQVIVTVKDANGCYFVDTLHPATCNLTATVSNTHDVTNHYTFSTIQAGGTGPFTYQWTLAGYPLPYTTQNILDSLPAGNYSVCVTVTDANSCRVTACDSVHVSPPTNCNISVRVVDSLGGNIKLAVVTDPSNTNWHYNWTTGSTSSQTTSTGASSYCVTVTDGNNCTASSCDTVCSLGGYVYYVAQTPGWNQYAVPQYGTAPYHYLWSNGDTAQGFYTTVQGVYHVTITDARGCTVVCSDTVGTVCYFSGNITASGNTGSVAILTATVYNNHGPVSYHWSNNASTSNILTVNASGLYCVTATDSIGCSVILCDSFTLGCSLHVHITDSNYGSYHILNAITTGGRAPFIYNWNPLGTNQSIYVNSSNAYCVQVTDANGCTAFGCDTVYICNTTSTITYSHTASNIYTFVAAVTGGAGPYRYGWSISPQGTIFSLTGNTLIDSLRAGTTYTVCVIDTDVNGCTSYTCDTIHVPSQNCTIAGTITTQSLGGTNGMLTAHVTGAHGTVTYQWAPLSSGSSVLTVTTPGTYCVTVTDSAGCTASICYNWSPCAITGNVTHLITGNVAVLTAHTTGAHGPVSYHWTGSTSNTLTVTTSGTYCVTVTDSTQCSTILCDTVHLTGCHLQAAFTSTHTGGLYVLAATSTGGAGQVTNQWRVDGGTLVSGSPYTVTLTSGTHHVCLYSRDTLQCSDSTCQTITVTTACNLSGYIIDSVVHQVFFTSHYYKPRIQNGTAPYTYHWSNGSTGAYLYASLGSTITNPSVTVTDANGCTAVLHMSTAYVDTFCGNVFFDTNGNGIQDGTEAGAPSQPVYLYSGSTLVGTYSTNASGHYAIPVHPGTYTIQYNSPIGDAITIPLGTSTSTSHAVYGPFTISSNANNFCGYNFGIRNNNVTISGYVYLDANNNGIFDAGETPVANELVHVGPHYVYTNINGQYSYIDGAGTYAITYIPSSAYSAYTVTPGSHSVNATTAGQVYGGNNFGLQQTSTSCNIATTIIPITTVTAGYPSWYFVYVSNFGTNVASGTMTYFYDPALTFDYASPAQASSNTAQHSLTFVYAGLQPGTNTQFYIHFQANTNVVVGQSTFELATATDNCNESNYHDNTDTLHQIATGSWDPNAKTVTPAGEGSQGLIRSTQELRYTLNFQNTGTAPAVNVVLRDSLPAGLDLSTLRVLGASHPDYALQVEGRQLTCRFSQIMLADSFDDEAHSHGYLSFAVSPVAGIADGAQIQNSASIYFDYNEGVQTNTTLNTIDYTLSVKDLSDHATITVVPNPFSDHTTIRVTGADMHDAVLDVYNALGQIVGSSTPTDAVFTFSKDALSSGIYTYHIRQSGRTIGTGKLVIE